MVGWSKPPVGIVKINTEMALRTKRTIRPQLRGVLRNSAGVGSQVSSPMSYCDGLTAKFWALRDGLQIAHDTGLRDLEVETYAREIIQPLKVNWQPLSKKYYMQLQVTHPEAARGDQARVWRSKPLR